jgi:hypothetical protein
MAHRLKTPEGRKVYALRKQTPEPVFVWHHQIGARIPSIFVARARQGARRVEPRDHGLEYEEDVYPHPRLTRPCAAWAEKADGCRSIGEITTRSGRHQTSGEAGRGKIVLGVLLQSLSPTGC